MEQNAEAYDLGGGCGEAGTGGSHMEAKDQQRVARDVQHGAGHQADHGLHGETLIAQDIVEDKAAHDEGGA